RLAPQGEATTKGFDNLEAAFKYQLYRNDPAESLAAIGLEWDIGGTGSRQIGAERFSTFTPTFYFGKGFGNLPDSAQFLKPFAVTGTVGVAVPARTSTTTTTVDPDTGDVDTDVERHPNVLQLGFAIQYSLQYLQSNVKDIGLGEPFNRMIPLVEFT